MSYQRHHKKNEATAMQRIVLNAQGYILESDDGIFSTTDYRNNSLLVYSPFLESIFDSVCKLELNAPELFFPRVETLLDTVPGVYNCSFECIGGGYFREFEWLIYDITQPSEPQRAIQQAANERSILGDLRRKR
ncbi:MAG: hypothetical protein RL329_4149 [Bacteroidota bacterium]